MDWPHFLVLGIPGDGELQKHKTLPQSTPKREELQFNMKTSMEKMFFLRRAVVLQSNSLESLLLVEANPSQRYDIIMNLQYMLDSELRNPLIDVVLVKKLLEFSSNFKSLRAILSR
ncbi:hypothetical protein LSM04_004820 [Trypanosoma melophagium]|uniref:uncharacterized protein n=1 Tax=Trypanosoma melophagium TaxID=715481 RepID=UPI00351A3FC5|nr:hypothetical protein LSM04_004820 [Trypanosoma melophagium]